MKKLFTIAFLLLISALFTFGQNDNVKAIKKDINQPSAVNATTYDFTTGADKYYGGSDAAVQLETGVWGMIGGDTSKDGVIDGSDFVGPDNNKFQSGYLDSDSNLDGVVDGSDFVLPDNNKFKSSTVPN